MPKIAWKTNERQQQNAFCKYVKLKYPKALFISDLAGDSRPGSAIQARSGKGMPDFMLFQNLCLSPIKRYCGLAIELKAFSRKKNLLDHQGYLKLDDHLLTQYQMQGRFTKQGWICGFAFGSKQACKILDQYMHLATNYACEKDIKKIEDLFTPVKKGS